MRVKTFSIIPEDHKAIACLNRFLLNGGGPENFSLILIMGQMKQNGQFDMDFLKKNAQGDKMNTLFCGL
jgi:hypothetical protein